MGHRCRLTTTTTVADRLYDDDRDAASGVRRDRAPVTV